MSNEPVDGVVNRLVSEARRNLQAMTELAPAAELAPPGAEQWARWNSAAVRLMRLIEDADDCLHPAPIPLEQITEFSPAEMVEALADVYGTVARDKGLYLESLVELGIPLICGGRPRTIEQALGRLLDNAVQFTPAGGVELRVGPAGSSAALRFIVADTGLGLPAEVLAEWESAAPFHSRAQAGNGMAGFGLALSRRLVEAAGGRLEVRNRPEGGCEASLEIAVSPRCSTAGQAAARSLDGLPVRRPLRLLVAEESGDSYGLVKLVLGGHILKRAWSGTEAVKLAASTTFDLIFMDVRLPDIDGYAASHEIRLREAIAGRRRVPIVILSPDPYATGMRTGAQVGCSGYLQRPVSREMLLRAVMTFVQPD